MAITYTSYDSLRGVLGIDDSEIEDERFDSLNLQLLMEAELKSWLPDHETIWQEGQDPSATDEQSFLANVLSLWAQYFCAAQITDVGTNFFQSMTDGEATFKRFDVNFESLSIMFRKKARNWKETLLELTDTSEDIEIKGLSIMGISSPSYDPVTGT
jgi:hypothetical protein